jgi:hypothetical protein
MQESGGKSDVEHIEEARGNIASDAQTARQSDHAETIDSRLRIRPINVFELARRVYSSKRTSLRRSKLIKS